VIQVGDTRLRRATHIVTQDDEKRNTVHQLDGLERPVIVVRSRREVRSAKQRPPKLTAVPLLEQHPAEHYDSGAEAPFRARKLSESGTRFLFSESLQIA